MRLSIGISRRVFISNSNDLVQQVLEQAHHGLDQVDGRRGDEHLAVVANEVEAWLDEPRE